MFKKAERTQIKLKIAITGPSGSGKTYSALSLAKGIGKKIAVGDSENGSASLYSDKFEFDTLEINEPYTTKKYLDAIKAAEDAGYDVLVLDSYSHAWAGSGGLLAKKEAKDAQGGNSFTNWASITKEHEQLKAAILNSKIHIIATLRSKQEYIIQENEKGKQAPKKVGMAPIQREGMEYEFTTVFDVAMSHQAEASKDRTGLFSGEIFQITEKTGEKFLEWLAGAKAPEPKIEPKKELINHAPQFTNDAQSGAQYSKENKKVTENQIKRLFAILKTSTWTEDAVKSYIKLNFHIESTKDLTMAQYDQLTNLIEGKIT